MSVELSVILPVFNEAESLPLLWPELAEALAALPGPVEVIFVDDGSTDGSADVIRSLGAGEGRVRLLRLRAHSGLSAALLAGFEAARGRVVATMDADLQHDPRDLKVLLDHLGPYDAAVGWRRDRRDPWLKRAASHVANGARRLVTGDPVRDSTCTLRVMYRECARAIPPYDGMHRFVPTLLKMAGYRVVEVPVHHRPRRFGRSKYGIRNRARRAFEDLLAVRWMQARRLSLEVAEEEEARPAGGARTPRCRPGG